MGYKFEKYSIGGGGSGIIDVTELPQPKAELLVVRGGTKKTLAETFAEMMGAAISVTFYTVDKLPDTMEPVSEAGFPVYIVNGTGVGYVSEDGTASSAITLGLIIFDNPEADKGWTKGIDTEEADGVYAVSEIDNNGVYMVDGYSNVECYVKISGGSSRPNTLAQLLSASGLTPNITYHVSENKPDDPIVSDLATVNPVAVYIVNDVANIYANVGYGNMWLTVSDVLTASNINIPNRGRIKNISATTTEGVYVTYDKNAYGVANTDSDTTNYRNSEGKWRNAQSIIARLIEGYFCGIDGYFEIPEGTNGIKRYAFYDESVADIMGENGLTVVIPTSVSSIGDYAFGNGKLDGIIYKGTKEQWKAISKQTYWDNGTGDYIITCTDGTIAKDGTET